MDKAHNSQRSIAKVEKMEKEDKLLYGVHNMSSWNKIKNKYNHFIVILIDKFTIRVINYTDDTKKAEYIAGLDPRYVLLSGKDI